MLSPIAVATWIAICIPWAEPRLAAALIEAGSGGDPYLLNDAKNNKQSVKSYAEAVGILRARLADLPDKVPSFEQATYIGLTQIPHPALVELGIAPEIAMDKCANLEIGYSLFLTAYDYAGTVEKTPWKRTSLAYNYYRTRQKLIDTPYAKRATDYLMAGTASAPASMTDSLYHAIIAEWSAGMAARHALRQSTPATSVLLSSNTLTQWARGKY